MSILDTPIHVIAVYREVDGTDSEGNPVRVPDTVPTQVPCSVQPLDATKFTDLGQDTRTRARVFARSFPAGAFALIEWDGRTWDVDGEPRRYGRTEAMRHVEVDLVARDPETLPIGG